MYDFPVGVFITAESDMVVLVRREAVRHYDDTMPGQGL